MTIHEDLARYASSTTGELFQREPEHILAFVQEAFSGSVPREELIKHHEFWYAVASAASVKTFEQPSKQRAVNVEWAHIANTTFKLLSTLPGQVHMMWRWMLFKVKLINSLGKAIDTTLATPHEIVNWFFDNLTIPFDEMQDLMKRDSLQIDTEKHMEMLYIKERAKIASYLKEGEHFQCPPELHKWIQLFGYDVNRRKRK